MIEKFKPVLISGASCYEQDGTAYLKLDDVARGLGFTQTAKSGNEVIRWERVTKYLAELGIPTSGDGFPPAYIPENIFYRLAMKAKNEKAEKFQALVADEIIPSIRKHGAYMTPQKIEEVLLNPDTIISLAQQLKEEKAKTAKLAPAAEYARNFLLASGGRLVSSIAKDYGMSAQRFNQILNALDIQYRKGGQWMLYQKYTGKGYTETRVNLIPHNDGRTHQHPETLWTARGCAFLSKQLAKAGIFPTKQSEAEKEAPQ